MERVVQNWAESHCYPIDFVVELMSRSTRCRVLTMPSSLASSKNLKLQDLVSAADWQDICQLFGFSSREGDVAQKLIEGGTEQDIARHLGLSLHTVHSHIKHLYRKANVVNRARFTFVVFGECLRLDRTINSDA